MKRTKEVNQVLASWFNNQDKEVQSVTSRFIQGVSLSSELNLTQVKVSIDEKKIPYSQNFH